MKFALMVNGSPFRSQGAVSAYRFARAALDSGHEVSRVFFYGDGAYNTMAYVSSPMGETPVLQQWRDLSEQDGVDLVLCSAAAERRGVLGALDGDVEAFPGVAAGFRVAGLALWMDACLAADRVVVFHG